jgi:hypothetical protein
MAASGAPVDAVNVARKFAQQYQGEVAVMRSFRNIGAADLVSVIHPFRPIFVKGRQVGMSTSLILISNDPHTPYVGDPGNIDKHQLEELPWYQNLKKQHPKLHLLKSHQPYRNWFDVEQQEHRALRHKEGYLVTDGVHDNQFLGTALFEWDFDTTGRFLRTKSEGFALRPL